MIPRIEYKNQIMREQYREYCNNSEDGQGDGMTFSEYVKSEYDNYPNFIFWLYDCVDEVEMPENQSEIEADIDIFINY